MPGAPDATGLIGDVEVSESPARRELAQALTVAVELGDLLRGEDATALGRRAPGGFAELNSALDTFIDTVKGYRDGFPPDAFLEKAEQPVRSSSPSVEFFDRVDAALHEVLAQPSGTLPGSDAGSILDITG